jgi:hypothetical protein
LITSLVIGSTIIPGVGGGTRWRAPPPGLDSGAQLCTGRGATQAIGVVLAQLEGVSLDIALVRRLGRPAERRRMALVRSGRRTGGGPAAVAVVGGKTVHQTICIF